MEESLSNKDFFGEAAGFYDEMIDPYSSLANKTQIYKKIFPGEGRAADIGCGTGTDSIALARAGYKVDAFDPSIEMINNAKIKSLKLNLTIDFHNYPADKIPVRFNNKFNLVVSAGNTFSNIPPDKFADSVKRIYEILTEKGTLFIHVLNFERILKNEERIINITNREGRFFVRFYDFYKEYLNFNILKFNGNDTEQRELITTKLFPYDRKYISKTLRDIGFKSIKVFGSLNKSEYKPRESKNLVVTAIK